MLFPFELPIYQAHGVPATLVGHRLADLAPLKPDIKGSRAALGIQEDEKILAVLPGSRESEVRNHGEIFLNIANRVFEQIPCRCFIPCVNAKRYAQLRQILESLNLKIPVELIQGNASLVLQASDAVFTLSGTATLEAMLAKKPMVAAYRTNWLTYQLAKRLIKIPYLSLPNILANAPLVQEFIQNDLKEVPISQLLVSMLTSPQAYHSTLQQFLIWHERLKLNASQTAASAILKELH